MKRTLVGAVAAAALLVTAAIAVADGFEGAKSVTAVSGTFGATTASHVSQRSCTTSTGKTVVVTDGTYTGTASGPAELTGNATVHARSVINTTDNVGVVSGTLKIDVASGRDTATQLTAVYSGGSIAGIAVGHAGSGRLVANLSGGFSAAGGFAVGSRIGGGTRRLGRRADARGLHAGEARVEQERGTRPRHRERLGVDHGRRAPVHGAGEPGSEGRDDRTQLAGRDPLRARQRRQHADAGGEAELTRRNIGWRGTQAAPPCSLSRRCRSRAAPPRCPAG